MKSQVLNIVWCHITGEAAGELWNWSVLGVKGLKGNRRTLASYIKLIPSLSLPWTCVSRKATPRNMHQCFLSPPHIQKFLNSLKAIGPISLSMEKTHIVIRQVPLPCTTESSPLYAAIYEKWRGSSLVLIPWGSGADHGEGEGAGGGGQGEEEEGGGGGGGKLG